MDNLRFERISVSAFSWCFIVALILVIVLSAFRFDKSINNNVKNIGVPIVNVTVDPNMPVAKEFKAMPINEQDIEQLAVQFNNQNTGKNNSTAVPQSSTNQDVLLMGLNGELNKPIPPQGNTNNNIMPSNETNVTSTTNSNNQGTNSSTNNSTYNNNSSNSNNANTGQNQNTNDSGGAISNEGNANKNNNGNIINNSGDKNNSSANNSGNSQSSNSHNNQSDKNNNNSSENSTTPPITDGISGIQNSASNMINKAIPSNVKNLVKSL